MAEQRVTLIYEEEPTTARRYADNLDSPSEIVSTKKAALERLQNPGAYRAVTIAGALYSPHEARRLLNEHP